MRGRTVGVVLLLLVVLAAGCEPSTAPAGLGDGGPADGGPGETIGADADPTIVASLHISTRSFRMGTAGFVPRHHPNSSDGDWRDLFAYGAAAYGGVYGVHVSPAEKADEEGMLDQVRLAFEQVKGVEPYVAFSVNHEDGPFTAERGEALKRAAVATARAYQPRIISLGVESNSLYLFQRDTFDLYVRYAREAYDEIKAVSPKTQVMVSFQLERMKGQASLTGQEFGPNWHLLALFADKIDLVGFTVYPFLEFRTVADTPDDYLAEIRDHTSLPVMITETGWPTENTASGAVGSSQDQIDYMMKLVRQANAIDVQAIVWVFPHDASFGVAGGIFDRVSLFDNDGNPKPAYAFWKAIHSLPLR